jgi:hypothetical protein
MPEYCLSFGEAIELCRLRGVKIARAGWNGKNMWVAWTPGSVIPAELARNGAADLLAQELIRNAAERPGEIKINGHFDMKTADGSLTIGWLASQSDMAADDWAIIP